MPTILGKEVGSTGYGLMGLTWRTPAVSEEQAFKAMRAALRSGANFWNGGEFYGAQEYNSLHLLRNYFTKYPEDADKVVLNIKGGLVEGGLAPDGSEKNVRRSVDYCVRMLEGRKKVDIFECARVDPNTPIETTVAALAQCVKDGKIGGIGLSEVRAETVRRAVKVHEIASVEVEVSLQSTDILTNGVGTTCGELGIPIAAYSPIARGLFGGQIKSAADLPEGDFRHHQPRFQPDALKKNLELAEGVEKLAKTKQCSPAQVAKAWVKALSGKGGLGDIIPIPGATTEERVLENGQDIKLDDVDLKEIREILAKTETVGDRYGGPLAALMNG
ncbi:MAG: Pyridoxine 4-dehydrogenase [Caeruleum heppii]|nr:MAG: Pyridoxine 4-dehydrogenase [Caeruleum heppii]